MSLDPNRVETGQNRGTGLDNDLAADYKYQLKRAAVDVKRLDDGTLIMRSPYAAPAPVAHPNVWLRKWAAETPDEIIIAQPDSAAANGWDTLTYADGLAGAETIAAKFAKWGLGAGNPVATLAASGIDHALIRLAAMRAGIPVVGLDPSISEFAGAEYLAAAWELTKPGLLYVDDENLHGSALKMAKDAGARIVTPKTFPKLAKRGLFGGGFKGPDPDSNAIATINLAGAETGAFDVAKIRGVAASYAQICWEQEAVAAIAPHLASARPVLADFRSWHRWDAGNLLFFAALRSGGSICIENILTYGFAGAAPLPAPTVHFADANTVYALLAHLELNTDIGALFFRRLDGIWIYGGTLPEVAMDKLVAMAVQSAGHKIPIFTGYHGDASPVASMARWFDTDHSRNLGLPLPGTFARLKPEGEVPSGENGEVYALHLMPPALGDEAADADDAGNYTDTGERVRLIDAMRPYLGIEPATEA
jgi:feruloyl-CoA synthase